MSTTQVHPERSATTTNITAGIVTDQSTLNSTSTNASIIPTTAIGLKDLPLELLADIADFVHGYPALCAMMMVSHHLRDGVSLSRRWRIVNVVAADVHGMGKRRKILFDREQVVIHAGRVGHIPLLRYLRMTKSKARCLCLPVACLHGNLECVRYLMTQFKLKGKATTENLFPVRLGSGGPGCEDTLARDFPFRAKERRKFLRQCPFDIACAGPNGLPLVKYFHEECGVSQVTRTAIACAARGGRLATLQYLHTAFGLTADDARVNNAVALWWACKNGHLPVVLYFHTAFGLTADDARVKDNRTLQTVCSNGHLPVVRYLHAAVGLTADDARVGDNHCLRFACSNGHLPVVQYLHAAFGLTADDARVRDNFSLRLACKNGHLPVVLYLHTAFRLKAADARATDNFCLRTTCQNGHLPVVRYLHTEFGLKGADAQAMNNRPLRSACQNGHLPVVRYVLSRFGLRARAVRATGIVCLFTACRSGHLPVVQYLHKAFGLTADDARFKLSLRTACENGHLPVVQYLHKAFGLTARDARADDNSALRSACKFGNLPVVQYLMTDFGLSVGDLMKACVGLDAVHSNLSVFEKMHVAFPC